MSFLQLQMYATAKHDGAFEHHMERFQKDVGPLSDEQIELARHGMLNPQDFILSVDKGWTLQALKFHDEFLPILFDMTWTVMRAQAPRYFITSDNPLVHEVPPAHYHPLYGGSLVHKHVEVTMPLSTDACLLATWKEDMPRIALAPTEAVKSINRTRAIYASRFLFGCRRDEGIVRLAQKHKDTKPGWRMSGFGPDEYSPVELKRGQSSPTRTPKKP
jgi:hypothetical protein